MNERYPVYIKYRKEFTSGQREGCQVTDYQGCYSKAAARKMLQSIIKNSVQNGYHLVSWTIYETN